MGTERRTFEVDGVTYGSIEDVPEPQRSELRRLLVDADRDGVPDVFPSGAGHVTMSVEQTHIEVDGVTYQSIDDVPEPQRSAVQRALGSAGRPVGPASGPPAPSPPSLRADATGSSRPGSSPIVSGAGSSRTKLIAAFVAIDAVAVGVIAWLLLR